jgi:hypothetical protein
MLYRIYTKRKALLNLIGLEATTVQYHRVKVDLREYQVEGEATMSSDFLVPKECIPIYRAHSQLLMIADWSFLFKYITVGFGKAKQLRWGGTPRNEWIAND